MASSSAQPSRTRSRFALTLVALFVLAPVLAIVIVSALLLFGVDAHLVFFLGAAFKSKLEAALGIHAPNSVAVASTMVLCWAVIVSVWLGLRRFMRRGR